jgi:GNAT superfamily N-acetyltransferase
VNEICHRRLVRDDAGEALTVQRAAFLAEAKLYATTDIPPLLESLDEVRQEIETTYSPGAFRASRLVGAIRLTVNGPVGWISRVAVAPDEQGRGIASALFVQSSRMRRPQCGSFDLWPALEARKTERCTSVVATTRSREQSTPQISSLLS